ncbi:MAG: right-handed parallel beta-helix repeat-containing protein [Chitinophagales bacterium]|nr:right-handed parallel beta-helix repeat-containing protein [Chitinophagales bacterium]
MWIKSFLFTACCLFLASSLFAQADFEKKLQTQLISAENGDVITLPEGKFQLGGTLWLDEKRDITIRGAGKEKTILSFKNQKQGAEGLKITNSKNIKLENFTIEDAKGDLIKVQNVRGITMREIIARWTGKPSPKNGSYALYPVQCSQVIIEKCTAIGASDAGIYVGQSDSVWVNDCIARMNVAGIEIENTTNAWVWNNKAFQNAGGLLVFDLPDLPKKDGGNCKVWNNEVNRNNYRNFAPKGNIVGKVPPGTGMMLLAADGVEMYNNQILNNKTASIAIISYYVTENPIADSLYNPYPSNISVHDNNFSTGKRMPTWKNKMGFLFWLKFGRRVPHILYDGIQNPDYLDAQGKVKPEHRICIGQNTNGSFANLKADKKFKGISRDVKPYQCEK